MHKPSNKDLARAREHFRALLSRQTKKVEWQKFFAENPYVLSMSLPLHLDPSDVVPMARPGRTEPDFVFYPQSNRPVPFYGIIELKRPDTKIVTIPRSKVALLSRDARTAIKQSHYFATKPGELVPIERPDKMLFLGNREHIFIIMGMSQELTRKLGVELYSVMIQRRLPGNLQILPYDTLLTSFEARWPHKLLFLVPVQEIDSVFKFETVTLDVRGNVIGRRQGQANQFVERLAAGVSLEMVEIPAGKFVMGAPEGEQNSYISERPQHKVTVPAFYIGKFTVTQAQWLVVASWPKIEIDLNPEPSHFKGDDRPVERVSWHDTKEFCTRLANKTGRAYRLPSEAEWEYACRAGTTTPFAFGPAITPEIVNYEGNYPYGNVPKGRYRNETIAVGSLGIANAFGLYDMHGNVWEWCEDVGHDNYDDAPADGSAWVSGGDQNRRRLRGGSWFGDGGGCRSAYRNYHAPDNRGGLFEGSCNPCFDIIQNSVLKYDELITVSYAFQPLLSICKNLSPSYPFIALRSVSACSSAIRMTSSLLSVSPSIVPPPHLVLKSPVCLLTAVQPRPST